MSGRNKELNQNPASCRKLCCMGCGLKRPFTIARKGFIRGRNGVGSHESHNKCNSTFATEVVNRHSHRERKECSGYEGRRSGPFLGFMTGPMPRPCPSYSASDCVPLFQLCIKELGAIWLSRGLLYRKGLLLRERSILRKTSPKK
jgi:hypothetical protein